VKGHAGGQGEGAGLRIGQSDGSRRAESEFIEFDDDEHGGDECRVHTYCVYNLNVFVK